MREHQKSAFVVAKSLETSPHVTKVIYPGLPSHPQHELIKRQAKGFSGMITLYVKGDKSNVQKFFDAVKVCTLCVSLFYSQVKLSKHTTGMVLLRIGYHI